MHHPGMTVYRAPRPVNNGGQHAPQEGRGFFSPGKKSFFMALSIANKIKIFSYIISLSSYIFHEKSATSEYSRFRFYT